MGICLHPLVVSDYVENWLGREPACEVANGLVATCDEQRASLKTGESFGCIHHEQK
jgi:hypothetical protein